MISPYKILSAISFLLIASFANAQTTHWVEDFSFPASAQNTLANGFNGWTVTTTGANGAEANEWFVSCEENGNLIGQCGSGCAGNATLHVGSLPNFVCPTGDCGAAYDAGGIITNTLTNKRAESPLINCSCSGSPVYLHFRYMLRGQNNIDYFSLEYWDGASWTVIVNPLPTALTCNPQGLWTAYSVALPPSAVNNPNVKIGFNWHNNNDGLGSDPSVAIDSIVVYSQAINYFADFTWSPQNICYGDSVTFTNTTFGPASVWAWDFGGGGSPNTSTQQNPTVLFSTQGNYVVSLTASDNCGTPTSTNAYLIIVNNCVSLQSNFTASATNICEGDSVIFTETSTGLPSATNFEWSFPGGSPSSYIGVQGNANPPPIFYSTAGSYDVTLIVSNGFGSDTLVLTNYITVNNCSVPVPSFTSTNQNLCVGDCIDFTDQSVGGVVSWNWTFNGASTLTSNLQNPTNICYNTPGTYDVSLTVSNGTNNSTLTMPNYITVVNCNPPIANFSTPITSFCNGTCITFNNSSTGNLISWNWSFPGGTPASSNLQNPGSICYNTPGVYGVTLTVADQFGNNVMNMPGYITVNNCPLPVATFNTASTNICQGQCINFNNTSVNATSWTWAFPGGMPNFFVGQNPPAICYNTAGIYDAALYVADANGNFDTLYIPNYITVTNCGPIAAFTVDNNIPCMNDCVTFTDASTNGATSWTWSFPGGSPSSFIGQVPPPVCYHNLGLFNVSLVVSDGTLSDTLTQTAYITVNYCGGILAQFYASDTAICDGDCISFVNTSLGNPAGYLWIIPGAQPDTSTSANPAYVCFNNPGNYDVTLIAFDSSEADTVTYPLYITVNSGTGVSTNIDSTTVFAGTAVQLEASGGVSYHWYPNTFLNNDSIANPIATPTDTINYVVVMVDANGCSSSETVIINVLPPETVWAPTAFTPNNDKSNDLFNIQTSGIILNYVLKIYDRWGGMVFSTNDHNEGWDGSFHNKPLNVGVYVYYYRIEYIDGFVLDGSGDVTLLK
ncbi:MAG TPA: hypothetical protein DCQ93_03925 [Bacteroidetes bacterium]|nr:hypothetical protein [Bacteroidota bacterium]